jgi:hypothetical protein
MPVVRIEHSVPSFDKWKQAFDRDPADRNGSGVRRYQILRLQNEPNYVMIDLEFDNTAEAEAFVQKMQRIWDGPAKGIMLSPRARIADFVEGKDV